MIGLIELTNFTQRALKRISPIYDDSNFIKYFFNAEGMTYDFIREFFKSFHSQFFIETVDWAIALQEIKYSLDVRPDLTLEERRRRLGLRAQIHRPINPARLEKTILEHFGIKTYLDEKKPGYIRAFFNYLTENGFYGMRDFLNVEKPAHLKLGWYYHYIEYGGGEGDNPPSEIVIGPDDDPPLPKTPDEKNLYPRIFYGIAQGFSGEIQIQPPLFENQVTTLSAGVAQVISGETKLEPAKPEGGLMILHAGVAMNIGGTMTIDSEDKVVPPRIRENPTAALAVAGGAVVPARPQVRLLRAALRAAPSAVATFGAIARGMYNFVPPTDDFAELEGDVVKIFFDFPVSRHRRVRGVAMPNARDNLTRTEIKAVGDYAVDNKLIMNERGEYATRVSHAALKIKNKIKLL